MFPFYNVPPHQPQYPSPSARHVPHNHPPPTYDTLLRHSDDKFRNTVLHLPLDPEGIQHCLQLAQYFSVHKYLFMHTYVHTLSCCRGRHLDRLVFQASLWKGWTRVQQLARHSLIRETLFSFGSGCVCQQHKPIFAQYTISDDDSHLLCLLLYYAKERELYELPRKPPIPWHGGGVLKESEEVVELLWKFLMKNQEDSDVTPRLRASIYRMARKSAYLPHALQIKPSSISNEQSFGSLTRAKMNGHNVIIKKIMCDDRASQRKCLEMFASEAILWKTLQHKNIVPFMGVVRQGYGMGLVSPFFENGNIKSYMKRYPRDWSTLARRWAKDLAEGLKYIHCHEPPIIHGDLKGDNVLVGSAGQACLSDFGQSHASDSGRYLDSTRVGLAASPFHWMAPEIMDGGELAKASDKSDIYSFGCVLYEMVSGRYPFEGHPVNDVLIRVTRGERPRRPESIRRDDPFWGVVEACWNHSPDDRPSAARLLSRLG